MPETYPASNLDLFPSSKCLPLLSHEENPRFFSSCLVYKQFQTDEKKKFLPGFSTPCSKLPKAINYQSLIFKTFLMQDVSYLASIMSFHPGDVMNFTMSESSCQKLIIVFSLLFLVFHLTFYQTNISLEKQKEIWQTFFFLSV